MNAAMTTPPGVADAASDGAENASSPSSTMDDLGGLACGPGGDHPTIQARRQSDIDRLAGCSVIHADLVIMADSDLDLAPLASLEVIDGMLSIGPEDAIVDRLEPLPLRSLHGLEGLQSVRILNLSDLDLDLSPLAGIQGDVEQLIVSSLPHLADLSAFSNFRVTRELSLDGLPDLVSLAGAPVGAELQTLSVSNMLQLESLAGLDGVQKLGLLWLQNIPVMTQLELPDSLVDWDAAWFTGMLSLTTLSELSRFTTISDLRVENDPLLADLGGGGAASGSLRVLSAAGCPSLASLVPVGGLSGLVEAYVNDCDALTELDALAESPVLEILHLFQNDGLIRLPVFDRAGSTMQAIRIYENASLIAGPSFPNLKTLYQFDAINFGQAELLFYGNPALVDIGQFPLLESSGMVTVSGNPSLEAVSLPSLQTLTWLRVTKNERLAQLELNVHYALSYVELDDNPLLGDVTIGEPPSSLQLLTLRGNPVLDPDVRQQLLDLADDGTRLTLD